MGKSYINCTHSFTQIHPLTTPREGHIKRKESITNCSWSESTV